ncbi:hypothetical protein SAMD00019534_041960 [Acytostelium subglobosum LB1]|uniref:hypothetical protein n=1 Tax=Acytostelium subglobosum LB1 TaxID=1410327 RepID=UPI000644D05C|nr:hypothetical protein SAMD00019534_041960 [Acytostelium subglobosum LB1]GAM21021.1 hypothetical protein SAMD00019534_041960 [Acytostelium subglobosum LB1]|eukprot:XP_012756155.1 hypothetical protein SAMD00019534_041960 [Acytostelium subglobosum LB1]
MSQLPILSSSSVGSYDQQQSTQQQQLFPGEEDIFINSYMFDPQQQQQQHVVEEDVNSNLHQHVDNQTYPSHSNGYHAGDDVSQFYSTTGDWHSVNHTVNNQEQSVSYQPPENIPVHSPPETPQSCYTPQQPPQPPQTPDPPQQQYQYNYYQSQPETGISFIPQHQTHMHQQPMMPSHTSTQEPNSHLVALMCPRPLAHLPSQMTQPSSLSPLSPLSQPLTNQHSQQLTTPLQLPQQPLNQQPPQMCQQPWTHQCHLVRVPTTPLSCHVPQHPSCPLVQQLQPHISIPLEQYNMLLRIQSSLASPPPQQPNSFYNAPATVNPFAQLGHPNLSPEGVVDQHPPLQQQLGTYSQYPDACASPSPSDSSELTSDSFSSDSNLEVAPLSPLPLKANVERRYLSRGLLKMKQKDAAFKLGQISGSFLCRLRQQALKDIGLNPKDHPKWPHRQYKKLKKQLGTSKRNRKSCIQRGTNTSQHDATIAKIKKDIDLLLTPMLI